MSAPSVLYRFDGKNEKAQAAAARDAGRLITPTGLPTGFVEETRAAIRDLVVTSIREGESPMEISRTIRSMVGMNAPQAAAAANYRMELIQSGLAQDKVEREFAKYVEQRISERAFMIARTETLQSLRSGYREGIAQSIAKGYLLPSAEKEWMASGYKKGGKGAAKGKRVMCWICAAMNGKRVPIGEKFTLPDGRKVDGPGPHPSCGCSLRVIP
jgi:hypothetical protein